MGYQTTPSACAAIKAAVEAKDIPIVSNETIAAMNSSIDNAQSDLKDLQDAVVAYLAKVDASETATTERAALDALLPTAHESD